MVPKSGMDLPDECTETASDETRCGLDICTVAGPGETV